MKRTKLLSLTALTLIGLLGLSSCSGEKGDKGDTGATGPAGETGPKGDKGDPGEDGEDGKDGSTWLTGTSKPADTLGNIGDMYLNTTNGDVYQKEESGWTLKMNIKGEDGEDGKDGLNGSTGSQGKPGETAWSNTILPTEGGAIIPSIGSGIANKDKITFTFIPDENYTLITPSEDISIVNKEKEVTFTPVAEEDGSYTVELTMLEGGYVVSAKFSSVENNPGGTEESPSTEIGTSEDDNDQKVINYNGVFNKETIDFAGSNKTINLNNVTLKGDSKTLNITGDNNTINISNSNLGSTNLNISGDNVTINLEDNQSLFKDLIISGENVTITKSAKESLALLEEGNNETSETVEFDFNGSIDISAKNLVLEGVNIKVVSGANNGNKFYIGKSSSNYLESFVATNCYFEFGVTTMMNVKKVQLENNTFVKPATSSGSYVLNLITSTSSTSLRELDPTSFIRNNVFDLNGKGFIGIKSYGLIEGEYDFSGNTFKNINLSEGGTPFYLAGAKALNNDTEKITVNVSSTAIEGDENNLANDSINNVLIAGDKGNNYFDYGKFNFVMNECTINGNNLEIGNTLKVGKLNSKDYVYVDNGFAVLLDKAYGIPTLTSNNTLNSFGTSKTDFFINGVYYSRAFFDNENNLIEDLSMPSTTIKFGEGSGDGLTKETALIINSVDDFKLLKKSEINSDSLYFKLNVDLTLSTSDLITSGFSGTIFCDENSKHEITVNGDNNSYLFKKCGYLGLENIKINLNKAVITSNIGETESVSAKKYGLKVNNCEIVANNKTTISDALSNYGIICGNITGDADVEVINNKISGNIDITSSIGSYGGLLIGGYISRSTLYSGSEINVNISNNEFTGTFIGERVGFIFGNNNRYNDSPEKCHYTFENNVNNGTIKGLLRADLFTGNAEVSSNKPGDDGVKNGEQGKIINGVNDINLTASKQEDGTYSVNFDANETLTVSKIEVCYAFYSHYKNNGGTLYVNSKDQDLSLDDKTLAIKKIAYSQYTGSEEVVKFDLSSTYLFGKDDVKETAIKDSGYDIYLRALDSEGNIIGIYKLSV